MVYGTLCRNLIDLNQRPIPQHGKWSWYVGRAPHRNGCGESIESHRHVARIDRDLMTIIIRSPVLMEIYIFRRHSGRLVRSHLLQTDPHSPFSGHAAGPCPRSCPVKCDTPVLTRVDDACRVFGIAFPHCTCAREFKTTNVLFRFQIKCTWHDYTSSCNFPVHGMMASADHMPISLTGCVHRVISNRPKFTLAVVRAINTSFQFNPRPDRVPVRMIRALTGYRFGGISANLTQSTHAELCNS